MTNFIASVNLLAFLTIMITIITPISLHYIKKFHDSDSVVCVTCQTRQKDRKKVKTKLNRIKLKKLKQRIKRRLLTTSKTKKRISNLKEQISSGLE